MEAILEPLVRSPKLRMYFDELAETLRREDVDRQDFRRSCDGRRVEFINGKVVAQVPTREIHAVVLDYIATLLKLFVRHHRCGAVRTEQALTAFTRNDYAPDLCFFRSEVSSTFTDQTFYYPVPDFVVEVLSPTTEKLDRGLKFEDYAAHGVREYWIVNPEARTIEQYVLTDGAYHLAGKPDGGVIRPRVIAGCEFPVAAAFDEAENLRAIDAMRR